MPHQQPQSARNMLNLLCESDSMCWRYSQTYSQIRSLSFPITSLGSRGDLWLQWFTWCLVGRHIELRVYVSDSRFVRRLDLLQPVGERIAS